MKQISKMLAIVAIALAATFSAQAKDAVQVCDGKVTVSVLDLAPNADFTALVTKYVIEVAPDAVEDCSSLVLTPIVKSGDTKLLSEIIVVNGKNRAGHNANWLECQLFSTIDPNRVRFFTLNENEPLRIISTKELPFDDWMDDAEFTIYSQKATYKPTNCIKALKGEELVCHVPCLDKPFTVYPLTVDLGIASPNFDNVAPRIISTQLFYPVNGTAKVEKYLENAEALEVLNALEQNNYYVSSIVINGWASPESSVSYNQKLSEKRAATLKNIIAKKYKFDEDLYTTTGSGEYWKGIEEYVATTTDETVAAAKSDIQKAIADNADLDKREAAIKKIAGGKPYKALLKNVYPHSRFADCVVTYKIKQFNLADAKILFAADPASLTEEDYVIWMNTEFNADVALKAAELYPESKNINAFAGCAAYEKGQYANGVEFFKKAGDSKAVANNMGCCYIKLGETAAAKECFKKAEGLEAACINMIENRKQALNDRYFAN